MLMEILMDRMAVLEQLPEDALAADGLFWEFLEVNDPADFSPALKAVLRKHGIMEEEPEEMPGEPGEY
jgi:hypothetical protein